MDKQANLTVNFAGLPLQNPFILAAGPPTETSEAVEEGVAAGWAGAVLKTVYPERLSREYPTDANNLLYPRIKIGMGSYSVAKPGLLEQWREAVPQLKAAYPDRVLIGSIGTNIPDETEWRSLAEQMVETGVDALEVSLAGAHNPDLDIDVGVVGEDPDGVGRIIHWVRQTVGGLPIIAKLPGTIHHLLKDTAKACEDNGAAAITAIGSIPGIAGVDLETLTPRSVLAGSDTLSGYSGPAIRPVAMATISKIARTVSIPVTGCGGVTSWQDAAEMMSSGATALQICTGVMWHGPQLIDDLLSGLSAYVQEKGFSTIKPLIGVANPYMRDEIWDLESPRVFVAHILNHCTNCGLCIKACDDGGFQAIYEIWGEDKRKPKMTLVNPQKCDGCGLCPQICPVDAIDMVTHYSFGFSDRRLIPSGMVQSETA